MFICEYCDKELKNKGGLTRHLNNCKMKINEDNIVNAEATVQEVKVELVNYYEGHKRREIKLRGLLSRTFDPAEREKICKILVEEF